MGYSSDLACGRNEFMGFMVLMAAVAEGLGGSQFSWLVVATLFWGTFYGWLRSHPDFGFQVFDGFGVAKNQWCSFYEWLRVAP